jgi:23S rRNA (cytidine2498-2'-O)-methyltransferase
MPPPSDAAFIFCACQAGAEAALKQGVARRHPGFRFAFSRPGFVTFRLSPAARELEPDLGCAFARTSGSSLGKVTGPGDRELAHDFWNLVAARAQPGSAASYRHVHVWQRDREMPGDAGFEPGVAPEAQAAGALLLAALPERRAALALNEHATPGDAVLDCVLVEPTEWWVGSHRAGPAQTRWPGGVPNLTAPPDMISRAYLKLEEALLWSGLPLRAGDRCVEIGSAPGGSCQALLERGCVVTGIDPAAMDARVLSNPRFTHVRARAKDVDRTAFRECRWLTADLNLPPKYTLDTVEAIVPQARIEGLVLTLKLTDAAYAAALPSFEKRVRSWGYADVRVRQLAFNRQEVCVVALRPGGG